MGELLPLGLAATALVLTYVTCLRPMRRGDCLMMLRKQEPDENPAVAAEIMQLRAEVAALRGEDVDNTTAVPRRKGPPAGLALRLQSTGSKQK